MKYLTAINTEEFKKITKKILTRDVRIFLVCLAISLFSWISMELSESFTNNAEIYVNYENSQDNKILMSASDTVLKVHFESIGFELLNLTINADKEINLDLSRLRKEMQDNGLYFTKISSSTFEEQIRKQLGPGILVKVISPDTLSFVFDDLIDKQVKVKSNFSAGFIDNYKLLGEPKSNPDSVEIRGAKSILSKLKYVETQKVNLKNLNQSKEIVQKLIKPKGVKWMSNSKVKTNFEIVQFTGKKSTIPIIIKNKLNNVKIKTFPASIEIVYNLPLKYFDMVNDSMFRVEVVFDSTHLINQDKLIPKLVKKPQWIDNVLFTTDVVDYIILK